MVVAKLARRIKEWLDKLFKKKTLVFGCPKCLTPMKKQPSWDVWHCLKCKRSVDMWYDPQPPLVLGYTEEYDSQKDLIVVNKINKKEFRSYCNICNEPFYSDEEIVDNLCPNCEAFDWDKFNKEIQKVHEQKENLFRTLDKNSTYYQWCNKCFLTFIANTPLPVPCPQCFFVEAGKTSLD